MEFSTSHFCQIYFWSWSHGALLLQGGFAGCTFSCILASHKLDNWSLKTLLLVAHNILPALLLSLVEWPPGSGHFYPFHSLHLHQQFNICSQSLRDLFLFPPYPQRAFSVASVLVCVRLKPAAAAAAAVFLSCLSSSSLSPLDHRRCRFPAVSNKSNLDCCRRRRLRPRRRRTEVFL